MNEIKSKINDIAKRRGIFWKSYEIYGGLGGFYDYGPIGSLLKKNILDLWINEFVIKDGLLLIDSPAIGPEIMYRASGHVEKFTDYMVKCKSCGHVFRADELLKEYVENPDTLDENGLWNEIRRYDIRCPDCGGELTKPEKFHLMFSTKIGLDKDGFLRPETAQGIFVNFQNLYRISREKLPMGIAQIGKAYRNEISPRQGLLRLREFNMAEIELFVDPQEDFEFGEDGYLPLLTNDGKNMKMKASECVELEILDKFVAYYMLKIMKFLKEIGINEEKIRFRQHAKEELAHYSRATWDCEVLLSQGWVEIIGISMRGDYDLKRHSEYSSYDLRAFKRYAQEKRMKIKKLKPKMEILGPRFKGLAIKIARKMEDMEYNSGELIVDIEGEKYKIPEEGYEVVEEEVVMNGERFFPHVIEPSFGIDRILYAILEHSYYERDDSEYKVLGLNPKIAPIKVGIFPLMPKDSLDKIAMDILRMIRDEGINSYYDESGSIGRRYARADEIGVPFCITTDYQTLKDSTVTIRDRDSTSQKRVKIGNLTSILKRLIDQRISFGDIDGENTG